MAANDEIFEVRLRINDPPGFIDFEAVANSAALPSSPSPQTAYKLEDTGAYVSTDKTSGATESDYEIETLRISDVRISGWIDAGGIDYATCKALSNIIQQLGAELRIKKSNAGAEDLEWNSLKDTYEYYKGLYEQCKDNTQSNNNNSTGKWGGSKQPETAGGNI